MLSLDECNPRQPPSANTTPAGLFTDLNLPVTGFPTTYHKSLNELQLIGNIVDDDAFHWMQIGCEKHHPTAVPEIGPPASRAFGFLDLLGNPCDPPSHPNSDSCFETTTAASSESAVAKLPSDPTSRGPSSSTTSKEGLNGNGSDKGIYPSDQQGTAMDREARVLRYREKRKRRRFEKQIRYASRKAYAEMRPRVKGRFVKAAGVGPEPPSPTPCIPNQLAMASWFHI